VGKSSIVAPEADAMPSRLDSRRRPDKRCPVAEGPGLESGRPVG
jgi:hypothetical protein